MFLKFGIYKTWILNCRVFSHKVLNFSFSNQYLKLFLVWTTSSKLSSFLEIIKCLAIQIVLKTEQFEALKALLWLDPVTQTNVQGQWYIFIPSKQELNYDILSLTPTSRNQIRGVVTVGWNSTKLSAIWLSL